MKAVPVVAQSLASKSAVSKTFNSLDEGDFSSSSAEDSDESDGVLSNNVATPRNMSLRQKKKYNFEQTKVRVALQKEI